MISKMLMGFAFVLAVIPSHSSATPRNYHLDCATATGKEICVSIRRVEINVRPCEGAGCDFYNLINLMDRATDLYIESLATSATRQAGDLAFSAASTLCHTTFTGERDQIRRLTVSANRFLEAMIELQELAGITDTMACEFEVDDNSTRTIPR